MDPAITTWLPAYLLTGAVAGLLAGLLGIGGGLVVVPALALLFVMQGFSPATLMHFAIGTSLATIVVTSIASLSAHHRRGSVHWTAVRHMTPGILLGALGGALLARSIGSAELGMVFGLFEVLVAVQLALGRQPAAHRPLPGGIGMGLAGGMIGGVSALLGIGGGTLTVPYLLWNGVDIRTAVGSAAACGLPIALAGAAGFALAGMQASSERDYSTGFIYWPAWSAIVIASVLFAPSGARLAHSLPRVALQRVFAAVLLVIGMKMIF